jgi:hypothetical protein
MSMPDLERRLSGCLRTLRIIVAALALGVIGFGVIAVVQREQNPVAPPPPHPITYLALGFAALQVVLQAVVPDLMATRIRGGIARGTWPPPSPGMPETPKDDVRNLCLLFQTRAIIGAAFVESAAFFLVTAYLLEGQLIALGGAVVMLALLLVRFPTRPGLESWLAAQEDLLSQDRLVL